MDIPSELLGVPAVKKLIKKIQKEQLKNEKSKGKRSKPQGNDTGSEPSK